MRSDLFFRLSLTACLLVGGFVQPGFGQQARFTLLSEKASGVDFRNQLEDKPEHNILIYSNYYGGAGVGIGDLNGDGLADLYFAGNLVPDQLYLNQGDMRFQDISEAAGLQHDGGWSTSVLLADINQDGRLDIYVTRELYDDKPAWRRNLLYENQGNDAAGSPIFLEKAADYGLADEARTRNGTFFDYDKDGDLDLFLLNQPPNPGNYSKLQGADFKLEAYRTRLYRNDGGSFTDVSAEAGVLNPSFGNSLIAADLNQDGWPDLYVANDFDEPDRLYLNLQNGRFANVIDPATRHISFYSMGVDAADLNNDGLLDISVLDMVAEDNFRSKANMSGMNPAAFWKVVDQGGHHQYMYNSFHLNQGNGIFSDIAQLTGMSKTDWSWSNLLADFDNDGHKDVFITNGLLRDIRNKDAEKAFSKHISLLIYEYITTHPENEEVTIWDVVDLDEALKLVPSEKLKNYAFRNRGNLQFEKVMDEWGLDQETFSNGSAYGDLDNDGDLDLVVNNINERAFVYRNETVEQGENHFLRVQLESDQPIFGAKATIGIGTETQFLELAHSRGIYSSSETTFHFGLGKHSEVDWLEVVWPDGRMTRQEKLAADQHLNISHKEARQVTATVDQAGAPLPDLSAALGIDFRHQENSYDDFEREVLLPHRMSTLGPCLAVADVNQDGREDFFIGGAAGSPGQVFLQLENGSFQPGAASPWNIHKGYEDLGATFFDADGDGDQDLYVVSGGNERDPSTGAYQDRLYQNQGDGSFKAVFSALPPLPHSGSRVKAFDLEGDGDLDLFVGGRQVPGAWPKPATSLLLRNESNEEKISFVDATAEIAPFLQEFGMVTDVAPADVDGDGDMDLMVVGEWMQPQLLENNNGSFRQLNPRVEGEFRGEALKQFSDLTGWWYSASAQDLDGDGDQDFLLGNLGLNYKYQASLSAPFEVYYEDFDGNGKGDIVLGYYEKNKLFPLRGRQCSSEQVPEIKDAFPTYTEFASATLSEVYGTQKLKESLQLEANTFASGYLENLGNGQFAWTALPMDCQLSSVNAIVPLTSAEGKTMDILLAGNLYGAEVETPRNDAGIGNWLQFDTETGFRSLPATETRLYLPYDVKDMAVIHSSLGKLLLVASNHDQLRVFALP